MPYIQFFFLGTDKLLPVAKRPTIFTSIEHFNRQIVSLVKFPFE
jgi:hypothetical protein